jgi:hypothetical protein
MLCCFLCQKPQKLNIQNGVENYSFLIIIYKRRKLMPTDYKEVMDTLKLMQKRLEVLGGAKIRERYKTSDAMKLQNELRSKHSNLKKNWTGTDEVRKWRERDKN